MMKLERVYDDVTDAKELYLTGHAVVGDPAGAGITRNDHGTDVEGYHSTFTFWDKKAKKFRSYNFSALSRIAKWCDTNLRGHAAIVFVVDGQLLKEDSQPYVQMLFNHIDLLERHPLESGQSYPELSEKLLEKIKTMKVPKYERSVLTAPV